MEEDKITLDKKTFKTLSSDTRISILKSLKRRRKMLTEISKEFDMSPSTIKGHMEKLTASELVIQIDDGHKWKYYELTRKGRDVLEPGETKVWIILVLSVIAIMFVSFDFYQAPAYMARSDTMITAVEGMAQNIPGATTAYPFVPYWHVIAFVVFSVLLGISIGYMLAKKKFYTFQGEFD